MFTDQGSEDSKLELNQLREKERLAQQRNHELQHMLLDLEAKLDTMKGQTQSASNLVRRLLLLELFLFCTNSHPTFVFRLAMICINFCRYLTLPGVNCDKVWMHEEIMTNNDNLESNLLTSSLLKMCSLLQVEPEICVGVDPDPK